MKNIEAIAYEINLNAAGHAMGQFQAIRRQIHGKNRGTNEIFNYQTINVNEGWAFNYGGRGEVQFNISYEDDAHGKMFRYGLAFSIEASRSFPNPVSALMPKVHKLNKYIETNATSLDHLRFWYWANGQRSPIFPVQPAPDNLIRNDVFLFWGKYVAADEYDPEDVLFLFDQLLEVYRYVEGNAPLPKQSPAVHKRFEFKAGCNPKAAAAKAVSEKRAREITLRHNTLQEALYSILVQCYGINYVGAENDTGRGSRVDMIVKDGEDYIYYEIKVGSSIRTCVREALAQLMEYSMWPGGNRAKKLVIVSENPLTPDTDKYLKLLRSECQIPVYYQRLDMHDRTLEPATVPDGGF